MRKLSQCVLLAIAFALSSARLSAQVAVQWMDAPLDPALERPLKAFLGKLENLELPPGAVEEIVKTAKMLPGHLSRPAEYVIHLDHERMCVPHAGGCLT